MILSYRFAPLCNTIKRIRQYNLIQTQSALIQSHINYVTQHNNTITRDYKRPYNILCVQQPTINRNNSLLFLNHVLSPVEFLLDGIINHHNQNLRHVIYAVNNNTTGGGSRYLYSSNVVMMQQQQQKTNDPHFAQMKLNDMLTRYRNGDETARPHRFMFRDVLLKWSKSSKHPEAADMALSLLHESKKMHFVWDISQYTSLLDILQKHRRWSDVEAVFREVVTLYKAGDNSMKPTKITLKIVLKASADAGRPEDANVVFTDIISEYKAGNLEYKPDSFCINMVLKSFLPHWRQSGTAEKVIAMYDLLKEENLDYFFGQYTYRCVLDCICRSNSLHAWEHGIRIYDEMKVHKTRFTPNLYIYASVMRMHMQIYNVRNNYNNNNNSNNNNSNTNNNNNNNNKENNANSVKEIERIISTKLHHVSRRTWRAQGESFCNAMSVMLMESDLPNRVILYQKVQDFKQQFFSPNETNPILSTIHTQITDIEDPYIAQIALNEILAKYYNNEITETPKIYTFRSILNKWGKLSKQRSEAANHSLALFHEGKKISLDWTLVDYNVLLGILKEHNCWNDVESVFRDIVALYKAGNISLKPDRITLSIVLTASSDAGRPEDAYVVFSDMMYEYKNGNLEYKPDTSCINLLLKAWLSSKRLDTAEHVISLHDSLKQEQFDSLFNHTTIGIVLDCIARSNSIDAWKNGIRIFDETKSNINNCSSLFNYAMFVGMHMKMYSASDDMQEKANSLKVIERVISVDVHDNVPAKFWRNQGAHFCNFTSSLLEQYKIPNSETLIECISKMKQRYGIYHKREEKTVQNK